MSLADSMAGRVGLVDVNRGLRLAKLEAMVEIDPISSFAFSTVEKKNKERYIRVLM
jgi:hypothetical protein